MTISNPLILILDQGGSSSRAIVFDNSGAAVASARQTVATEHPRPGWVEQSPMEVVDSLRQVASSVVDQLDERQRQQLTAAGLVCQRSSLVAWDRATARPLTPVLSWQDTRASAWLSSQSLDVAALQRLTGLYPNAHFGASKMRWCLDHLPQLKKSTQLALAPLASFLLFSLLEEKPFLVDPANASRTLLMDLSRLDWSPQLLDTFGIAKAWLPPIVPSRHDYGVISISGLCLPFGLLNGDQSAAAFAGGMPRPDYTYINVGTGAFIYRVLSQPELNDHLLCSLLFSDGEHSLYAMEGTVNGAASALHWFEEQIEPRRVDINILVDAFFQQQARLPLFLNGIGGLGAPDWRANFPTRFVGEGSQQQKALAILESIGFLLLRNFQRMYTVAPQPKRLVISGGLSRVDSLCQLLADLSGVDVERVVEQESTARGAAFLLTADTRRWHTAPGDVFSARDNPVSLLRYQQWTVLMEQALI